MRIMQLAQFVPPVLGGEERHVWTLARSLVARGHEVTLLGFATGVGGAGETLEDGVRVVRVRTGASRLPWLYTDPARPHALPLPDPVVARVIRQELSDGHYDVAHAHNWIVNSLLGPAARARVPIVLTLHDYSHVCVTKRLMNHDQVVCAGPALRRCLPCATSHYGVLNGAATLASNAWAARRRRTGVTRVAAVSSSVAGVVAPRAGGRLIAPGIQAEVVPNFVPDEIVVDEVLPPEPDAPLLFAGDLSRDKGAHVLLEAYLRLDNPPPLVLAGRIFPGHDWDVPPGVFLAGPLPHEEVLALFRSARAIIVPSLCPDSCPTVVLEAMAAGRPVVASATGGIVDVIVDGESGVLVRPDDVLALANAITMILKDPEGARRLGQAGRDRVRQFTVSAVVDRIERLYQSAIDRTSIY